MCLSGLTSRSKSLCNGELKYEQVHQALLKVFGGDRKPNPRDLSPNTKTVKDDGFVIEDDVNPDEEFYMDDEEDWYETYYEDEMEEGFEAEIPEDLEEAADVMDEAYISYVDSRRRMKELALSRGFYPIVAIGPEYDGYGSKGKSKGKGKSKSRPSQREKERSSTTTTHGWFEKALHIVFSVDYHFRF